MKIMGTDRLSNTIFIGPLKGLLTADYSVLLLLMIALILLCYYRLLLSSDCSDDDCLFNETISQDKQHHHEITSFLAMLGEVNLAVAKDMIGKIVNNSKFSLKHYANFNREPLDGSILHFGDETRFSYRMLQLLSMLEGSSQRRLRIAVIGGSNTGERHATVTFFESLLNWLRSILMETAKIDVTFINAATSGVNSEYYASCIEQRLNLSEIDILLLEHAINDVLPAPWMSGYKEERGRPMEELTRAVWRVNPMVHLIQVNMMFIPYIFNTTKTTIACDWIDDKEYLEIAQHYSVTSIQWKHLFCNTGLRNETISQAYMTELFDKYIAEDYHHCNDLVHGHLGVFLVNYFQKALLNLHTRLLAYGDNDLGKVIKVDSFLQLKRRYSMKPLYNTTWIDGSDCFIGQRMKNALRSSQVPLSAAAKGSKLQFHLNSIAMKTGICQSRGNGYLPRLSIGYKVSTLCSSVQLNVRVVFLLSNSSSSYIKLFSITTLRCPFFHEAVHLLSWYNNTTSSSYSYYQHSMSIDDYYSSVGYNQFCLDETTPVIESIDVEVEIITVGCGRAPLLHVIDGQNEINLPYFVIGYDCCRLSGDGKTILFT